MKVYIGTPPHSVEVFTPRETGRLTEPLRHHVRHSPTGFSWGYGGSGPGDLARCILIDHLGVHEQAAADPEFSLDPWLRPHGKTYMDFKFDVIAAFDMGKGFELTSQQIAKWIAE